VSKPKAPIETPTERVVVGIGGPLAHKTYPSHKTQINYLDAAHPLLATGKDKIYENCREKKFHNITLKLKTISFSSSKTKPNTTRMSIWSR
jgi:hypothetical protein